MKRIVFALLIAAAPHVTADTPDDFAWQWPVRIGAGGVHRLVLTPEVYDAISRSDARDLALFTRDGRSVSFGPQPTMPETPWRDAPYALEIGTITRVPVVARGEPVAFSPQRLTLGLRSRVPQPASIQGLRVTWRHRAAMPADATWRVEDGRGAAIDADVMAHAYALGSGLGETRLALSPFDGDTLRLSVSPVPSDLEVVSVLADYSVPPGPARAYRRAALVADGSIAHGYRFHLPPALPVNAARIDFGDGGALATVSLSVNEQDWWRAVASDTAFDIDVGTDTVVRNRLAFPATRAKRWRLTVEPDVGVPIVEVGYFPDVFLIAHPGPAELVLVAGSARATRVEVPIEPMLRELHGQFGAQWQPPEAQLGARSERGGKAMLKPAPPAPPYRAYALWAVLIGAAAAVIWLALRLLREPARD